MDLRTVQGLLASASKIKKFNIGEYAFEINYSNNENGKIEEVIMTKPKGTGIGLDFARKIAEKCKSTPPVKFGICHDSSPDMAASSIIIRMFEKLLIDTEKEIIREGIDSIIVNELTSNSRKYFRNELIKCLEKAKRLDCMEVSEIHIYTQEDLETIIQIVKEE